MYCYNFISFLFHLHLVNNEVRSLEMKKISNFSCPHQLHPVNNEVHSLEMKKISNFSCPHQLHPFLKWVLPNSKKGWGQVLGTLYRTRTVLLPFFSPNITKSLIVWGFTQLEEGMGSSARYSLSNPEPSCYHFLVQTSLKA